jgi:hypothetical protein
MALQKVHGAAQVRHFSDSPAHDKVSSQDRSSGLEQSPDQGIETSSNDANGHDTGRIDRSSVDPAGQR